MTLPMCCTNATVGVVTLPPYIGRYHTYQTSLYSLYFQRGMPRPDAMAPLWSPSVRRHLAWRYMRGESGPLQPATAWSYSCARPGTPPPLSGLLHRGGALGRALLLTVFICTEDDDA